MENSRELINLVLRTNGVDPSTIPNDSVAEQRAVYLLKNASTVTGAVGTGVLTSDTTAPDNNDTVTIGDVVYTFKTTIRGVKATQTLTASGVFSNNDTVTIDGIVYTFKTTLTGANNEVLIGADAATSLDNLKLAINAGSGAGTLYGTGTTAHPTVTAEANTDTTQVVQAKNVGTAGNSIATTETGANSAWGAATLTGGTAAVANDVLIGASAAVALDNLKSAINKTAGEGTTYSYGTQANPYVTATTNTDTAQTVEARYAQTGDIATTETSAHLSWGAAALASDLPAVVAKTTRDVMAVSGGQPV